MTKLEIDIQTFFNGCEIMHCDKQPDYLVYTVAPAYLEQSIERANEVIKLKGLNLIAKRVFVTNKFIVEEWNM